MPLPTPIIRHFGLSNTRHVRTCVQLLMVATLLVVLVGCTPLSAQGLALSPIGTPAATPTATRPVPTPTISASVQRATAERAAAQRPGWALIWQDEFDGPTLDASKWNVVSDAPGGYHNCCLNSTIGAWAPDDVSLVNGSLRLTTERRDYASKPYTSGAVTTEGKFAFLYGRIDIRGRVPQGDGLWPAFWLLPVGMSGNVAPYEVDVMEALGQDTHTDYMVGWAPGWHDYCQYRGPDFSADFHVYSFIWTPTSITWLVDDAVRCNFTRGMPTVPMYLLLNDHIGGGWPVPPDASTHLPQYTDIDYVRVYAPPLSEQGLP